MGLFFWLNIILGHSALSNEYQFLQIKQWLTWNEILYLRMGDNPKANYVFYLFA